MAVIKCKMCGGDLVIEPGATVAECEYCGSRQTVPNQDSEKKLTLFARANRLRAACEFDKAAGVYESIVAEFPQEAEAYWGLVLCKYGIEYVDDPATGRKIPTCHRSSFESVLDDGNFDQAQENADVVARKVYREEAKQIEELRKGIIEVSAKEEPYDIFICYKETDEKGGRTLDSVLAQDIYNALTEKGYRVFFSRITLEDKLGQEYEPYIFAALNSAKIMLAVGTDYEYYNAVWVKNEWSRYLMLMAKDRKKHLIPCYKNIDAYDMPKEFTKLQAQNMGKVGAMQDLLRGIEKILPKQQPVTVVQEKVIVGGSGDNKIASLLDRGNMALEDGDWAKADSFFEDVLNNDSKNAQAYLGKTLAQERCRTIDALVRKRLGVHEQAKAETRSIPERTEHIRRMAEKYTVPNYVTAEIIQKLYAFDRTYPSEVSDRQAQYEDEKSWWENHKLLSRAEKFGTGAVAENLQQEKKNLFAQLAARVKNAQDADAKRVKELEKAYDAAIQEADRKTEALSLDGQARRETDYQGWLAAAKDEYNPQMLRELATDFSGLGDYRDSRNLAQHCEKRAEEEQARLDAEAERQRKIKEREEKARAAKMRKTGILAAVVAAVVVCAVLVVIKVIIPTSEYKKAEVLYENGQYAEAAAAFEALGDYRDSVDLVFEVRFAAAMKQFELGNYDDAEEMFRLLEDYAQSEDMITQIADKKEELQKQAEYLKACSLLEERDFADAEKAFAALGEYSDSSTKRKDAHYQKLLLLWELYTQFDLHEVYLNIYNENGKIVFNIPEEFYNQIADDFENAYDASIADPYEIALCTVEHNEHTDLVVYDDKNNITNGFFVDVIADGMKKLGDYKDAAEFHEKMLAQHYANAVSMKETGNYKSAISMFTALGEYEDSIEQIELCRILPYANAQVGDVFTFGTYNDADINWRVLAREGNSVLIITESCIAERHFQRNQNDPKYYVNSPIRDFLNQSFYKEAFTEEQKSLIQEKRLSTTGGDVTDKLFLLSDREANYYFTTDAERVSKDGQGWYLRTVNSVLLNVLNCSEPIAMMVTGSGQVYQNDWTVDYARGIRPACWLDVSELVEKLGDQNNE